MEEEETPLELTHLKELLVLITGSTNNRYIQLDEGDVDEEAVKQWFKQLNQEVKIATSSLDYQVKGHTFIVPQFFKLLHQCLLSHRWEDALKILEALAYEPKGTSQVIWRAGMEVLYSNPKENDAFISQLFRQLKLLKDVHAEDVVLEYLMYLLNQGRVDDAVALVKQKEQRKAGVEKSVNLPNHPPFVYKAYKGLVWYVEWLLLKHGRQNDDGQTGESWQASSQANYREKKLSQLAHQAITLMEGVVEQPGVWDTFIVKIVELKEEYESVESALSVLTRYRDQNPANPNSHRYLYQFYERHDGADEDKIQVLKDLADRNPSNLLVLDLCSLLNGSPSVGRYLFDMLDYCDLRDKVKPWKKFRKYLVSTHTSKEPDNMRVVQECWEGRQSWWPVYHFNLVSGSSDKSDPALVVEKAVCCALLVGRGNTYTGECVKLLDEKYQQRLHRILASLEDT